MFGLGEKEEKVVVDPMQKEINRKYNSKLREMIMEEIRMPGTYQTKIHSVIFSDKNLTSVNEYIYHDKQIVNVFPWTSDGFTKGAYYIFWRINDVNNEVYKEIEAKVRGNK